MAGVSYLFPERMQTILLTRQSGRAWGGGLWFTPRTFAVLPICVWAEWWPMHAHFLISCRGLLRTMAAEPLEHPGRVAAGGACKDRMRPGGMFP